MYTVQAISTPNDVSSRTKTHANVKIAKVYRTCPWVGQGLVGLRSWQPADALLPPASNLRKWPLHSRRTLRTSRPGRWMKMA